MRLDSAEQQIAGRAARLGGQESLQWSYRLALVAGVQGQACLEDESGLRSRDELLQALQILVRGRHIAQSQRDVREVDERSRFRWTIIHPACDCRSLGNVLARHG